MPSLVELRQDAPFRRCRGRKRDYAELRAQNPVSPGVELLGRIREAARSLDPEDGIELIYCELDILFSKGLFGQVDELLDALDVENPANLPVLHLLALTSITNAAREQLRSRAAFVERVRAHLTKVDSARVEELLAGLE